ncbi:MAG: histidine phosphatase family protein [Gammaproteobacteria bacterium]
MLLWPPGRSSGPRVWRASHREIDRERSDSLTRSISVPLQSGVRRKRYHQAMQEPCDLTPKPTVIDLLRHGEVEGGVRFRGSTDDPLSRQGWQQMERVVGSTVWHGIISSPLRRCADFAQAFAEQRGVPLHLEGRLREVHFGLWEGRTAAALMQAEPEALARFWQAPYAYPPPGAESLPRFERRVLDAWNDIIRGRAGRRVLVITHGGVIRVILRRVRGLSPDHLLGIDVPHASLHRVLVSDSLAQEVRLVERG